MAEPSQEAANCDVECPRCHRPMEKGQLDLKAWGIGVMPQAQLHFNDDLVLKNTYWPLLDFFREGTKATAFRCKACCLICFQGGKKTE